VVSPVEVVDDEKVDTIQTKTKGTVFIGTLESLRGIIEFQAERKTSNPGRSTIIFRVSGIGFVNPPHFCRKDELFFGVTPQQPSGSMFTEPVSIPGCRVVVSDS
jgi:hypothetical protein